MPADLSDHFSELADSEFIVSVVVVFAAFMAGTVLRNVLEGRMPFDVPDEVYGVGVAFAGSYAPDYQYEAMAGGGLYTVDKLAERFELKDTVTQVGGV